jgi:acyl carrier protein
MRTEAQSGPARRGAAEVEEWLVRYLAALLEVDPEQIDPAVPFHRYGLGSAAAVAMTGDLEEWIGCEIDPTLPYDYPTIAAVSRYLGQEEER